MKPSKPLVFFGTEDFSASILLRLIEAGYHIKAAVTKPDAIAGRGGRLMAPRVKQIAQQYNIPVMQPKKLSEAIPTLTSLECEFAVLVAYGKIIPESALNAFPGGIVNIHPSLLPKYRGPSPIETAILNGDETTGVSLMKLVSAMDAGPVYAQTEYPLGGYETRHALYEALTPVSATLLLENLPAIFDGSLQPIPQDESQATYCHLIKKQDGIINWYQPASVIAREVRAYLGWPSSQTQLFNQNVIVLEAKINETVLEPGEVRTDNYQIIIGTGEKSLEITKLRPAGRSSMDAADFLRGLRI